MHQSYCVVGLTEILGRTLIVVAHPDDEVIGCGALLQRMREPIVVFSTDGAPRLAKWWQKYGSREAYARLRRNEAQAALAHAGVRKIEFLSDSLSEPFVDQELFRRLPQAIGAAGRIVERHRPQALLTHAYEGGHPDHDACCFITWMVAQRAGLPAWEMPLYHRDPHGNGVRQQFIQPAGNEIEVQVSAAEEEQKRRMLQAYPSQGNVIAAFDSSIERVRPLYQYDFTKPPHPGKLNYEEWGWEMTGHQVALAFTECMNETRTEGASSG